MQVARRASSKPRSSHLFRMSLSKRDWPALFVFTLFLHSMHVQACPWHLETLIIVAKSLHVTSMTCLLLWRFLSSPIVTVWSTSSRRSIYNDGYTTWLYGPRVASHL